MFLLCNFTTAILFTVKSDACWVRLCVRVLRWWQSYTAKCSMTRFIREASKKIIHTWYYWQSTTVYIMVQGRCLGVASGAAAPVRALEGAPRFRPKFVLNEFVKVYSPVNRKCWYMLCLKSFFKVKFLSVVVGCLLYRVWLIIISI
jgi:hypothetical protein